MLVKPTITYQKHIWSQNSMVLGKGYLLKMLPTSIQMP
jgi:hypothetical protein